MDITTKKMSFENSSDKTFAIAQKIADAACELDFLRNATDPAVAIEAEKQINILHGCATELAGGRAREIYEQINELLLGQPETRRKGGAGA